jgi:hypothetical protein
MFAQKSREFYQITVYHFTSAEQENAIDGYLKNALVPALHRRGIKSVGVFKARANDTASDKRMYVLIPFKHIEEVANLSSRLLEDQQYLQNGKEYLDAPFDKTPYVRMENIVLLAFELAPRMSAPNLSSPKSDHVYELRSYESGTEKLYRNKVQMFNQGGEIKLFDRLKFNAVFYAEVISGCRMPNLMYMTSFENMQERDAHWKTFGQDPEWKNLSSLPEYQKNVSKSDIMLLKAAEYSDY